MNNKFASLIYGCRPHYGEYFLREEYSMIKRPREKNTARRRRQYTLKFISVERKTKYIPLMTLRVISNGGELEGEQL